MAVPSEEHPSDHLQTGVLETAVDGLDDPILLIQRNAQGVQCLTSTAIRTDCRFSIQSGKCGMTGVSLAALGADACVVGILFHNHIPSLL